MVRVRAAFMGTQPCSGNGAGLVDTEECKHSYTANIQEWGRQEIQLLLR